MGVPVRDWFGRPRVSTCLPSRGRRGLWFPVAFVSVSFATPSCWPFPVRGAEHGREARATGDSGGGRHRGREYRHLSRVPAEGVQERRRLARAEGGDAGEDRFATAVRCHRPLRWEGPL